MYINWPFWNRPLLFSSSCYYCLLSSFEKSVKSYPPDPPQFSTSLMSIFCDTPPPVTKLINKMVCNKNWLNSTLSVKFVLFANYRITSSVSGFHYHLPKYIYIFKLTFIIGYYVCVLKVDFDLHSTANTITLLASSAMVNICKNHN